MNLDLVPLLMAVAFIGTRIAGLMTFAPFLSSSAVPLQVKAGLTMVLTALVYPLYGPARLTLTTGGWMLVMCREAVIGLLLGLTLQFIFDAVQLAGQVLGVQMGFSLVNVLDPQSQVDTPVLASFHQLVTLLIFLHLDVHHWLLRGLVRSFTYLPPDTAAVSLPAMSQMLQAASGIWLVGVQIAAPALVATMVADVAMGFLGKAAPQLPVLFIGLSVKSVLGMVVLIGGLALWPQKLERQFAEGIAIGEHLLHLAR